VQNRNILRKRREQVDKKLLIPAAVLAASLAGAFAWHYRSRSPAPAPPSETPAAVPGRTAPPFSLADISGNVVPSSQFLGKPTVINFFASWCPPCRAEIPGFVEVHEKYRGRGLEIVGISLDTDTRTALPRLMMENRIGYKVLLGNQATAKAFGGVSVFPTTFFVGRDGVIRKVHVGYMDRADFEKEIKALF
jgi:cytochrome c biogenesis protein CcmG/thiol:disulfide interchange protein DsbE